MTTTLPEAAVTFLFRRGLRGRTRAAAAIRGGNVTTLVRVQTTDGLTFAMDPEAYLDGYVIRDGYYEREVLDAVLEQLPEGGVYWDVGGNVGLHAITVAKRRPDARIVAFEPAPAALSRFIQNAMLNGVGRPQLTVLGAGLGAEPGYASLSLVARGNSGLSSFSPLATESYETEVQARVESGDALLAAGAVPRPDVVKLDVEGYEPAVLAGLSGLLASPERPRALVVEGTATHETLASYGYRVTPLTPRATPLPTNFLATC